MAADSKPKKILIATPLYPPAIGGPSQYAKNLAVVWRQAGHQVLVENFGSVLKWPTGIRHLLYFFKLCRSAFSADFILILDTYSAALPAVVVGKIFGKQTIIRTGGDFLWESYVERTGDLVLFKNFYEQSVSNFNRKERTIFRLTKFILRAASIVVFSTDWQRQIFIKAYGVPLDKTQIIENYFGPKEVSAVPDKKVFIGATRSLKWKNHDRLAAAFAKVGETYLDSNQAGYEEFMVKIKNSYAVILASLGDISPNLILDAIRLNKPFILTKENGLESRISGLGLRVDPENINDIADKIKLLLDDQVYQTELEKIKQFNFVHDWRDIADEFLALNKKT